MATTITTYDTWDVSPEFPVEVVPSRVHDLTPSSGSYVQSKNVQQSVSVDTTQPTTRRFVLRWKHATEADWTNVVSLWESSARGALPVAYTPPDGTEVAVRMAESPKRRRISASASAFSVTLEEVSNA